MSTWNPVKTVLRHFKYPFTITFSKLSLLTQGGREDDSIWPYSFCLQNICQIFYYSREQNGWTKCNDWPWARHTLAMPMLSIIIISEHQTKIFGKILMHNICITSPEFTNWKTLLKSMDCISWKPNFFNLVVKYIAYFKGYSTTYVIRAQFTPIRYYHC